MEILNSNIKQIKAVIDETLWPTRCAICDKQGYLLCPACASKLKFIDQNKTCKICGEPFGKIQCCSCNPIDKSLTEEEKHQFNLNYDRCLSALLLDKDSGRIVVLNKDAGEQRLSYIMSYFISKAIPEEWKSNNTFITYIPASTEAYRKRGFDHSEQIAKQLSKQTNLLIINCFKRPASKDQRSLGRSDRAKNLSNKFSLIDTAKVKINQNHQNFIIVDDVYTTGATLNAAAKVLKNSGSGKVYCISFARTF